MYSELRNREFSGVTLASSAERSATSTVDVPRQPAVPLEEVVEAIRRDSRVAPEQYLDETVAEFGGE